MVEIRKVEKMLKPWLEVFSAWPTRRTRTTCFKRGTVLSIVSLVQWLVTRLASHLPDKSIAPLRTILEAQLPS